MKRLSGKFTGFSGSDFEGKGSAQHGRQPIPSAALRGRALASQGDGPLAPTEKPFMSNHKRLVFCLCYPQNATFEVWHLVGGVSPLAHLTKRCYKDVTPC
jgi:hypothetical protein